MSASGKGVLVASLTIERLRKGLRIQKYREKDKCNIHKERKKIDREIDLISCVKKTSYILVEAIESQSLPMLGLSLKS